MLTFIIYSRVHNDDNLYVKSKLLLKAIDADQLISLEDEIRNSNQIEKLSVNKNYKITIGNGKKSYYSFILVLISSFLLYI